MRVRVLYFAAVAEMVARQEEEVELPVEVGSVGQFAAWLAARFPALAPRMASVRIARNEQFAVVGEPIADGDVLAVIPPVAGG